MKTEEGFRIYVADGLQMMGNQKMWAMPYSETLKRKDKPDLRSGDEIAMDVIRNAGLSFGEGE